MACKVDWRKRGVLRVFSGCVTGEEILESNLELHQDPRFGNVEYVLNDFSAVSEIAIDLSHVSALATSDQVISDRVGSIKIAIVISGPEQAGLAKAYKASMEASRFSCEVFQSRGDARAWLGS